MSVETRKRQSPWTVLWFDFAPNYEFNMHLWNCFVFVSGAHRNAGRKSIAPMLSVIDFSKHHHFLACKICGWLVRPRKLLWGWELDEFNKRLHHVQTTPEFDFFQTIRELLHVWQVFPSVNSRKENELSWSRNWRLRLAINHANSWKNSFNFRRYSWEAELIAASGFITNRHANPHRNNEDKRFCNFHSINYNWLDFESF